MKGKMEKKSESIDKSCPKQWLAANTHILWLPSSYDWMACHDGKRGFKYDECPNWKTKEKCWEVFTEALRNLSMVANLRNDLSDLCDKIKGSDKVNAQQYMDLMVWVKSVDMKLKVIQIIGPDEEEQPEEEEEPEDE